MKETVIFDGRDLYDLAVMALAGFEYWAIDRHSK